MTRDRVTRAWLIDSFDVKKFNKDSFLDFLYKFEDNLVNVIKIWIFSLPSKSPQFGEGEQKVALRGILLPVSPLLKNWTKHKHLSIFHLLPSKTPQFEGGKSDFMRDFAPLLSPPSTPNQTNLNSGIHKSKF
jgi:hypothetical protein